MIADEIPGRHKHDYFNRRRLTMTARGLPIRRGSTDREYIMQSPSRASRLTFGYQLWIGPKRGLNGDGAKWGLNGDGPYFLSASRMVVPGTRRRLPCPAPFRHGREPDKQSLSGAPDGSRRFRSLWVSRRLVNDRHAPAHARVGAAQKGSDAGTRRGLARRLHYLEHALPPCDRMDVS